MIITTPRSAEPMVVPAPNRGVFCPAAMGAVVAISPFDVALPRNGWTGLYLRPLMLVSVALAVLVLVFGRRWPDRRLVGAAVLVVSAIAVTALASDEPTVGLGVVVRMAVLAMLFIAAATAFRTPRHLGPLTAGLTFGVMTSAVVGLVVVVIDRDIGATAYLVGSISESNGVARLTRPFSHAGVAAMYLAPALGYLVTGSTASTGSTVASRGGQGRSVLQIMAVVFGALALSLTLSRTGSLALALALTMLLAVRARQQARLGTAWGLAPPTVIVGLAAMALLWPSWSSRFEVPTATAITAPRPMSRLQLWSQAINAFGDGPLLGVGPGRFGRFSAAATADGVAAAPHAHNLWFEILATGGLVLAVAVAIAALMVVDRCRVGRGSVPMPLAVATVVMGLITIVDHPVVFSSSGNLMAVLSGAVVGLASTAGDRR